MSSSGDDKTITTDKPSRGFRKTLASLFKSPATANYNRVLAETYEKNSKDSQTKGETDMTDEEKAKALVEKRDASSPTGNFVLGVYKPLSATQGYSDYYTAKGATEK